MENENAMTLQAGPLTSTAAIAALAALAQESRLAVFRLLVQTGPEGMAATKIAEALAIAEQLAALWRVPFHWID